MTVPPTGQKTGHTVRVQGQCVQGSLCMRRYVSGCLNYNITSKVATSYVDVNTKFLFGLPLPTGTLYHGEDPVHVGVTCEKVSRLRDRGGGQWDMTGDGMSSHASGSGKVVVGETSHETSRTGTGNSTLNDFSDYFY